MEDEVKIESANASIYRQQDSAAYELQIETARKYPRNITRCVEDSIAVATMDLKTANLCTYSVVSQGNSVTGPSVNLARILFQEWGNIRLEKKVVEITDRQIVSECMCYDLQKNIVVKVQVRRSIMEFAEINRTWVRMSEDMITTTGNAANAIAERNAVFQIIPRQVVDKVYEAAKNMITGDLSSEEKLLSKRKEVFGRLRDKYKVTEEEILQAIGKASMSDVKAKDIVILIGIETAIKGGDTTVNFAFKKNSINQGKAKKEELKKRQTKPVVKKVAKVKLP